MIKPLPEFAAEGTLRVVTRNVANKSEGVHTIQIGQELHISTKLLDNFCFKSPTSFTYDLMTVIGAVVYADCLIHRHHSDGWARAIKIQLPVYQLGKWRDPAVTAALKDCIDYLTGDSWQFEFRPRKERANSFAQEHLVKSPDREYVFIPYSDGLDSYAQLKLLLHREPQTEAIGVFTDRRSTEKTWNAFCRTSLKEPVLAVPVPVYIDKPIHAEPSFRSRPFMFYLIAAYGAYLNGASRVLIPENGQGSLG